MKRPMAASKRNEEHVRSKKNATKKKKSKKRKTKEGKAIIIAKDELVPNVSSSTLLGSIFKDKDGNGPADDTNIGENGTPAPSSLIDSIFDTSKKTPIITKAVSSTMTLFSNSKVKTGNYSRQFHQRKQEQKKAARAKVMDSSVTGTSNCNDTETIRRIMQRRKARSQCRPLMKTALDFPGVFQNEVDENGGFLLDDESERVKETADAVRDHGFCILRNVIHADNYDNSCQNGNVHPLRDVVLPAAKALQRRLNAALKSRGIHYSTETFRFREAASRCKGRTDVVFNAFERDKSMFDIGKKILRNPQIFPVVQNLLGGIGATAVGNSLCDDTSEDVKLVYAGLIFSYPGSCDQPWHQDGMPLFPELPRDQSAHLQASLPPYALNVFLPLEDEDGSIEKGPTEFLPGSHHWTSPDERLGVIDQAQGAGDREESHSADRGDDATSDDKEIIAPVLKQGDALIYDYRVCHRGTANLFGKLKPAMNHPADTDTNAFIAQKTKEKQKINSGDREIEFPGTRRILYLMFARQWFTDHVNFDYTKSAESVFGKNCKNYEQQEK